MPMLTVYLRAGAQGANFGPVNDLNFTRAYPSCSSATKEITKTDQINQNRSNESSRRNHEAAVYGYISTSILFAEAFELRRIIG